MYPTLLSTTWAASMLVESCPDDVEGDELGFSVAFHAHLHDRPLGPSAVSDVFVGDANGDVFAVDFHESIARPYRGVRRAAADGDTTMIVSLKMLNRPMPSKLPLRLVRLLEPAEKYTECGSRSSSIFTIACSERLDVRCRRTAGR